ncbi:hypothetical protein [Actinomycetospora chibensis]|uniref:Uncharacterized protein n=1 Tax=Actinomycetospora chibensis TaxID=663606 RepID=A0ABV9RV66_9PSEU|nr:hypothetical protein [Actinomycetospora chibensis]MDD7925329.1 hypothetical protein [Actinomycetospora chibensis]
MRRWLARHRWTAGAAAEEPPADAGGEPAAPEATADVPDDDVRPPVRRRQAPETHLPREQRLPRPPRRARGS